MLAKVTHERPSQRLRIDDEVTALAFDLAVGVRLVKLELDGMETQAKLIAFEVGKALAGKGEDDDS
jgi:hypothetical protein